MNILGKAIAILMLIPMILGGAYAFFMMKMVEGASVVAEGGELSGTAKLGLNVADKIVDKWVQDQRDAMFDMTTLDTSRQVTVSRTATLAEMLEPGVPMPAPNLHELFAEGRATRFMRDDCRPILDTIGTRCVVVASKAKDLGDGRFKITADLAFLPADTPGDLTGIETRALGTSEVDDLDGLLRTPFAAPDRHARQAEIYTALQAACAEKRQEIGTCVIERVTLDEVTATDGTRTFKGRARLAHLNVSG